MELIFMPEKLPIGVLKFDKNFSVKNYRMKCL